MKRAHLVISILLPLLFGSSHASGGERVKSDHWAFQPVKRPAVPVVRNAAWARTPLDAFILAKLEKHGIEPNEPADKETLLRRATLARCRLRRRSGFPRIRRSSIRRS